MTDIKKLQEDIKRLGNVCDGSVFIEEFISAFNLPHTTIERLKAKSTYDVNTGIYIGQQLFYLYSQGSNLYSDFNILKKNDISSIKTRFIVIANDSEILAYDLKTEETLFTTKQNLFLHIDYFFPLIGREKPVIESQIAVNIKVGEQFARLYNECILSNPTVAVCDLNNFICLLLLICFFNSSELLFKEKEDLSSFLQKYSDENGSDFAEVFTNILKALNSSDRNKLPYYYHSINFIDSRLFDDVKININFSRSTRNIVISIISFDWAFVDPEILGALIQSIIIADEDSITGNYTATSNVQKVIGPLFLNKLYVDFEQAKTNKKACYSLIERIKKICIFDPSCGCGNFLLVSYKELNQLLRKISRHLELPVDVSMPIGNFYGIEKNSFSCKIARIGLLFSVLQDHSNNIEYLKGNISILFDNNICCANPNRVEWDDICLGVEETYIIGNPPYKGARKRNNIQNSDMDYVFRGYSNYKDLDFAACWFLNAAKFIKKHEGSFAFVTTNSLTQGEQVGLLWPKLFNLGMRIQFGHTSFKWRNDARNTTAVTVVIIGVVTKNNKNTCELYTQTNMYEPKQISPYLIPGTIYVEKASSPISNLPPMIKGNMPYDGGYLLLSPEEKRVAIANDSRVNRFIKKIVGSDEFINGKERWCIWIPDVLCDEALRVPFIADRVNAVRELRLSKSDSSARKLALRPHQFREMHETKTNSLVVPSVSSENYSYIPVGFIDKKTVVSNLAFVIYDCEPWIMGVVASKMHNLWIKSVCGGLETRVRYSNKLGYNTFPFPDVTDEQKEGILHCVYRIIIAREEESDKTFAQMYKSGKMSEELEFAHSLLDYQIDKCYRDDPFVNDTDRLDCLFDLYKKMTEK